MGTQLRPERPDRSIELHRAHPDATGMPSNALNSASCSVAYGVPNAQHRLPRPAASIGGHKDNHQEAGQIIGESQKGALAMLTADLSTAGVESACERCDAPHAEQGVRL